MGDISVNTRDRLVDNAWHREVFTHPGFSAASVERGYDASHLSSKGVNHQQQLDRIHARFDVAKKSYETTGENKYFMMQKDLRGIADDHLSADLREFRLSRR